MVTSEQSDRRNNGQVSIIIPTYNESQNIVNILKSIGENLPDNTLTEAIVVDDNSPDGTGKIVEDYLKGVKKITGYTIDIIHRKAKKGLSSAILNGIQCSHGDTIVVMDSDFSHPPSIIPKMIQALKQSHCDIVIASRYVTGGAITGWSFKRKFLSLFATKIAKKGLGIKFADPMSGFFAFKRHIIKGLKFDAIGYKLLLEILVKAENVTVKEIPFTFTNRTVGSSKFNMLTIFEYLEAVWKLYRYGKKIAKEEKRASVHFISKAARFYTVGVSGFFVNYLISLMFASGVTNFWYLHATVIGISVSMTTNFLLNKTWTFEDRDFGIRKTFSQYTKFIAISSLGAVIQLGMVYFIMESYQISFPLALIIAALIASVSNFILNKKLTFKEKVWS